MIGRLRGVLIRKRDGIALLDVGGVGYEVHCSDRTLATLPKNGAEAILYTELLMREDLMQLIGFADEAERECYKLLTSVQGVGARAALAILGALGPLRLARALSAGDTNSLRAAPGIGPKLASRIGNELKEKAAHLLADRNLMRADAEGAIPHESEVATTPTSPAGDAQERSSIDIIDMEDLPHIEADAISALVNLGYDRIASAATIAQLSGEHQSLDALITSALRSLAPKV